MNTYHHPIGEGLEKMQIAFSDSYVTHSFDFYIHPNWSIESVRQIVEDAITKAVREEIGRGN